MIMVPVSKFYQKKPNHSNALNTSALKSETILFSKVDEEATNPHYIFLFCIQSGRHQANEFQYSEDPEIRQNFCQKKGNIYFSTDCRQDSIVSFFMPDSFLKKAEVNPWVYLFDFEIKKAEGLGKRMSQGG